MQSLAVSHDNGLTYDIYPANSVITMETEARDPNMFWDNDKKQWILVLAHALEHEDAFLHLSRYETMDSPRFFRQGA